MGNGRSRYAWARSVRAATTVATAITATTVAATTVVATAPTIIAIATAVAVVVVAITAVIATPACMSTATTIGSIGRRIVRITRSSRVAVCRCFFVTKNKIEDEKSECCQNEAKHIYPFISVIDSLFIIKQASAAVDGDSAGSPLSHQGPAASPVHAAGKPEVTMSVSTGSCA